MDPINSGSAFLSQQNLLRMNQLSKKDALQRLATGIAINRAKDNPAGLISSESLRAQLAAIEAESNVVQRVDYVAQTADGALGEVSDLLHEAEALVVANSSSFLSDGERQANQTEIDAILNSVNRVASSTSFNGTALLNGSATLSIDSASVSIGSTFTTSLGEVSIDGQTHRLNDIGSGGTLSADGSEGNALQALRQASREVAQSRAELGSFVKHNVEPRRNELAVAAENLAAAESSIRDTDFARETANLVRYEVQENAIFKSIRELGDNGNHILDFFG